MNRVRETLKVRPGEGRMAALVTGLMLFTSAGGSIGGNGIEALFFSRFGVQFLPYMFMALGALTFVTSLAVTALLGRIARERLYIVLPPVLALLLVGERALVALDLRWFYPILWLGMNVFGTLQGLLTWGLAGAVCDTRQAKRLFPLFAAGGILGAVVGGLGTRPLVAILHAENLLLVWAAALGLAFVIARGLVGRKAGPTAGAASRRRAASRRSSLLADMQQGFQFVRRSPLMRWVASSAVLFSLLYFSLSLPFARAATQQFPDEDALAGFFGVFQGLNTGGAFLASLFLANRLYARFGIMSTLLAFPLIYLIGFGALALYASFPVLVAFRFIQMLWLAGIASTAYQAVLNIIPPERRDQTRAFVEGVPGQAGTIIAGLVLVIGEQTLQPQQLYWIGLVAAGVTVLLVWQASRAYGGALVEALRAGQPQLFFSEEEPFGGFQRDAAAVAAAVNALRVSNPDPMIRRVSAEILGNIAAPEAMEALVNALDDPDASVRAASLRGLARAKAAPALLEVAASLNDPESGVRLQAVEALRRLSGYKRGVIMHVRPLLSDPDPAVRARAALALLDGGSSPEALDALKEMAMAGDAETRVHALQALGESGEGGSFELVAAGLNDPNPAVRRAAADGLIRVDADRAIELLVNALGDEDRSVRETVAAIIGRAGPAALDPVVGALGSRQLEYGALLALEHLPAKRAAESIRAYARHSVTRALHYHDARRSIEARGGDERAGLLIESLAHRARRHGINALRAIALLSDRASILLAVESLQSYDANQRANALETLESVGDRDIVRPLLKLWEAAPSESEGPAADGADAANRLHDILHDPDSWLRACAALAAGGYDDPHIREELLELSQTDSDAVVRDAAAKACDFGAAAAISRTGFGAARMQSLSLMERILFLRRVPLFAGLAPAEFKRIAAIAVERFFRDGAAIAQQGEPGEEMFIIVTGAVRVVTRSANGGQTEVARQTAGGAVGEMSIITHGPRNATLIAAGGVQTLCIDHQNFEAILRERPETRLAVMRVLCARLRQRPAGVLAKRPPPADRRERLHTLSTLSLMERILFLRRVPLFADLEPADLKQVASIAVERYYLDGEVIAEQGQPGDEMYIIVSGEVRVESAAGEEPPLEVARRRPGEYVGEMAIISQELRMASLIAAGDVRTLCIDQKQFEGILRERPETGLAVLRVLCARVNELQNAS